MGPNGLRTAEVHGTLCVGAALQSGAPWDSLGPRCYYERGHGAHVSRLYVGGRAPGLAPRHRAYLPACLSAWTSSPGPCGSSAKLQRCSCRAHVTSLREGCDQDPTCLKPWSCGHWGQCCELWCLCHPPSAFPKSHAWQLHALSFTFLEPSRMLLMVRRCGGAPL